MSTSLNLADCINDDCPFSGKPVKQDCLTLYKGAVVGFCNPGCRDKFAKEPEKYPDAMLMFDGLSGII